ncbi:glycosyl hydrolase family 95 catalytic domain-containing protein [Microbispora catharanthi]|uniref:glycosyl hydrolase family 95 catalytic domain-containing protein n=1 Tax=Microbispora catharanthi TaxID=1712871 RepID=UPI001F0F96BF|nr:hypothetical protein [Microbispora catharanthi]
MWNDSTSPPWSADYHVNINLQMNYWPAEQTNLDETTRPYDRYISAMVAPGAKTAREMYGARGWVVGNETNPFGFTGVHDWATAFWFPEAAAWTTQQLYDRYRFTRDVDYLRETAYPVIKGAAEFWLDFLHTDPRDGTLVVKVSLAARGDGGTGWSKAWKINFWARLLDGDHALKMLGEQIKTSTLDNLWGTHPPFQIDGNLGATSGVAEMLVQSRHDYVHVLPALPPAWRNGSFSGLRARGEVTVDATWKNGAADTITVHPGSTGPIRVKSGFIAGRYRVHDEKGHEVGPHRDGDTLTWNATAGKAYIIQNEAAIDVTAPAATAPDASFPVDVAVTAIRRRGERCPRPM